MEIKTVNQETIKILQKLGLTLTQSKIYLIVAELGIASVLTISRTSGMDRAEIYRKIPSLIKLGLLEKILGIPAQFKALPLKDGLNILLKQESLEHLELHERTKNLIKEIKDKRQEKREKIENQFIIIPGKKSHVDWLKKKFEESQESIKGILTLNDEKTVQNCCEKELQKANDRGVKSKVIIYIPENQRQIYENLVIFNNNHLNDEKRIVRNCPLVFGGIFDNIEVVVATTLFNPIENAETVFWSCNPSIVALFSNYFEELWNKAIKIKKEKINA